KEVSDELQPSNRLASGEWHDTWFRQIGDGHGFGPQLAQRQDGFSPVAASTRRGFSRVSCHHTAYSEIVIGLSSNCRLTAHRRLVVASAARRGSSISNRWLRVVAGPAKAQGSRIQQSR